MATSDVDLIHATAPLIAPVRAMPAPTRPAGERQAAPVPALPVAAEPGQQPEDPAAVQSIRHALEDDDLSVGFFQVEGASSPVIRVYNRQTGEVVRQIPEDEVLRLRERFAELLGVMADRKA